MSSTNVARDETDVDIYRDTPVRLLGYANEVGEAFRALVHVNWVRASYGVSITYVLADTYDKAKRAEAKSSEQDRSKNMAFAAIDTVIWQGLASVIIPGFTINRVCAASLFLMSRAIPSVAVNTRKWATTGLGLSTIPFIVRPIDTLVDVLLDNTTRRITGTLDENQSHLKKHH